MMFRLTFEGADKRIVAERHLDAEDFEGALTLILAGRVPGRGGWLADEIRADPVLKKTERLIIETVSDKITAGR